MTRSLRLPLAALAALASLTEPGPATSHEGDEERKITVMTRPRPELDALGLRLGSFLLFPALSVGESYTDNVFKTDGDRRDDFVSHIEPGARLASDWSNHALELGVDARVGVHADHGSEDYEDVAVWTRGRVDIARATNLFGGLQWEAFTRTAARRTTRREFARPSSSGCRRISELRTASIASPWRAKPASCNSTSTTPRWAEAA